MVGGKALDSVSTVLLWLRDGLVVLIQDIEKVLLLVSIIFVLLKRAVYAIYRGLSSEATALPARLIKNGPIPRPAEEGISTTARRCNLENVRCVEGATSYHCLF